MSNWNQHLYTHRTYSYWKTRELNEEERSRLHVKSVFNYYGFWVNGLVHLIPLYLFYKRGFFNDTSELVFWKNLGALIVVSFASKSQIDWVFNLSLCFEMRSLADKYECPKDGMRKKYQMDKTKLNMIRVMKYQEMRDRGHDTTNLIKASKDL